MSDNVKQLELSPLDERALVALGHATWDGARTGPTFTDLAGATQLKGDDLRVAIRRLERRCLLVGGQDPSLERYRHQYLLTAAGRELYRALAIQLALPKPPPPRLRPSELAERVAA